MLISPANMSSFVVPEPRRIGLVGCVKSKRDRPSPARDLYTSPKASGFSTFL